MSAQIGSIHVSLTADVGAFSSSMARAERAVVQTSRSIRREAGLAESSVTKFTGSLNTGIRPYGLIAVSRAFERMNDRVSLLRGSMLALTGVFGGFTAAIGSNLVLRYADSFTNLSNQIRVVSKDSTELAGRIAAISAASERSRSSLQSTATLYARLQKAAPTRTSSEILGFTETIQRALALGGATAQEAASAAIQFSQAIASNRLGGEELRAILETPLGLELAKGLGVTIGKFREMGHAGELTADVILGALAKARSSIDEQFSRSVRTIDQSLVQADNRLTEYVGSLDEAYGLTRLVSGAILGFADNIDVVANSAGLLALALGSAFGGKFIGGSFGKVIDSTFGEVARRTDEARGRLEEYTKEQARLQTQLEQSTRAFANLQQKADIDFASKGELSKIAREEAKLARLREQRVEATKKIAEAQAKADAITLSGSKQIQSAAQKIVDTEGRIIENRQRQITLTQSLTQAQTRLNAALGMQATSTAKVGAVKEAERDILNIRKEQQKEADRAIKLENSLGEQRVALATRIGAAEAKAAEQKARYQAVARAAAKESLNLQVQEFAQTQRLAKVRAQVNELGSINKMGEVRVQTAALGALSTQIDTVGAAMITASKSTSVFRTSMGLLLQAGQGLYNFLGGFWGVLTTAGVAAFALYARSQAQAAAQADRTKKALQEVLGEMAKKGEASGVAEQSARFDELSGRLDKLKGNLSDFTAAAEAESEKLGAALRGAFVDIGGTDELGASAQIEAALGGARVSIERLVDQAAKGDLAFASLAERVRNIPELKGLNPVEVERIARAAEQMALYRRAVDETNRSLGQTDKEMKQSIGALNEFEKARLVYKNFAESVQESERALNRSNTAFGQLIAQTKILSQESDFERSIRERSLAIQKDNADLTAGHARELATVQVVLETIRNSSDEWLRSNEALNGEFGKALATLLQMGYAADLFVKTLNSTQLAGVTDILRSQTEAARIAFERSQIGERQAAVLNKEAAILDEIRQKYGTINGISRDRVRETAEAIVDLERASAGLETAKTILEGLEGSVDGSAKAVGGLSSILAQSGIQAGIYAKQQMDALDAVTSRRQQISDLTASLEVFRDRLANIGSTMPSDVFGSLMNTERVREQVGFLVGSMGELGEKFIKNKIDADQLVKSFADIEQRLLALGANKDPLRNFITSVLSAIGNVRSLSAALDVLAQKQQKVGSSGVRTNYPMPNGGSVGVTRHTTGTNGSSSSSAPTLKHISLGSFAGFATGGFTGNAPADEVAGFVHGKEYVFDAEATRRIGVSNLEAIRRGVGGYESGGAVSATSSALIGGADRLKMIEENTFRTVEELVRSIGYYQSIDDMLTTALGVLRDMQASLASVARGSIYSPGSGSSGGGSSGGFSSGGSSAGGFSSGGTRYSSNDPKSPYYYGGSTQPGGPVYDPLADAMLNGNMGALKTLGINQIGSIYTNISSGLSSQDFYSDMINSLIESGPQLGTYGGGINITADSDFLSRSGMFGSGGARPGALTDWTLNRMTARQEELMAYGPNKGTAANLKKLGFNSGGMIHPGDTQRVSFFKNPKETVGIFTPQQMDAMQNAGGPQREVSPLEFHYHAAPGNPDPSPQSMMEAQERLRGAVYGVNSGL